VGMTFYAAKALAKAVLKNEFLMHLNEKII
jgi:hypothetical protein